MLYYLISLEFNGISLCWLFMTLLAALNLKFTFYNSMLERLFADGMKLRYTFCQCIMWLFHICRCNPICFRWQTLSFVWKRKTKYSLTWWDISNLNLMILFINPFYFSVEILFGSTIFLFFEWIVLHCEYNVENFEWGKENFYVNLQ